MLFKNILCILLCVYIFTTPSSWLTNKCECRDHHIGLTFIVEIPFFLIYFMTIIFIEHRCCCCCCWCCSNLMPVTQAECQRELVFRFSRISFEFSSASFASFASACLKSLAGRLYTFIALYGMPFYFVYGLFAFVHISFFGRVPRFAIAISHNYFVFSFIIWFAFVVVDFAYFAYFCHDSAFNQLMKLQLCTDPPKNVTKSSKLNGYFWCWWLYNLTGEISNRRCNFLGIQHKFKAFIYDKEYSQTR